MSNINEGNAPQSQTNTKRTIEHRVTPDSKSFELLDSVINGFAHDLGWPGEIIVMHLGRFGFSGAKLYQVHTENAGNYVVKIADKNDIKDESRRHTIANRKKIANSLCLVDKNDRAILYDLHIGAKGIKNRNRNATFYTPAETLKDYLDEVLNKVVSKEWDASQRRKRFLGYISKAFDHLTNKDNALSDPTNLSITSALTDPASLSSYFREKEISRHFLDAYWDDAQLILKSADIKGANPLAVYDHHHNTTIPVLTRSIHGDLHGSNIMLVKNNIELIDFAWLRSDASYLIDYIMLENSLRFMSNPLDISQIVQAKLSADYSACLSPTWTAPPQCSTSCWEALSLVRESVILLRNRAFGEAKSKSGWNERTFLKSYLTTQFFILAGQLKYSNIDRLNAVLYLALIANSFN